MDPAVTLLRDLVAINSVNPSLVPGAPGEAQVAAAIAQHLRRIGLDVESQEVAPGRPNVIGVLDGRSPGPSLIFCGHIDTVGVDGMPAPFDPVVRDGRLYGRGAQDMKGGVAAMIDAARIISQEGLPAGRLIVAAVVDEEYASLGADALVTRWRADGAVVTEPTDLQIAIGHKGFAWFEVVTRRPPHPLMGTASLHASLIEGGRELSSYPDRCVLTYERRTIAGEDDTSVDSELARILDALKRADPEFDAAARRLFSRPCYEIPSDHPLPRALQRAAQARGHASPLTGMSFWTDAAVLGAAGTPSVLFGPGGAGLHSVEEYVTVEDVTECRDALAALAREWLAEKKGA
jgi:acetylornithine deacetylase